MEDGYTRLGTVLTDRRPEDSQGDSVIVVGRFKGDPHDGVELSYDVGRRNLYLTQRGAAPGIPARGGSRKGNRHPVGITGSRWLTTEIRLLGLTNGRPDIAPETQRGALSIALIPAMECLSESLGHGDVGQVKIIRGGHAIAVCVADVPVLPKSRPPPMLHGLQRRLDRRMRWDQG